MDLLRYQVVDYLKNLRTIELFTILKEVMAHFSPLSGGATLDAGVDEPSPEAALACIKKLLR